MYICPMHPDVKSSKPGDCPECGMKLVKNEDKKKELGEHSKDDYSSLIVLVCLIFTTSLISSYASGFSVKNLIEYSMIGFFLVFSGFKIIDLKGFAEGYSTYDLIAKKNYSYGYVYPFIELFFGLSMILGFYLEQILMLEIVVMGISGLGVAIKLAKHERFRCVCLGTFLKVPITYITLIEDFGMVVLAVLLLIIR